MVEDHLYMIDILIKRYLGKGVEYDDLYQAAAVGLVEAADRFDPTKGFEFSTFATATILGEIKKHFRDTQWNLKVPRTKKERALKVRSAEDRFTSREGRAPTAEELAVEAGLTREQVIEALDSMSAFAAYSLDGDPGASTAHSAPDSTNTGRWASTPSSSTTRNSAGATSSASTSAPITAKPSQTTTSHEQKPTTYKTISMT